MSSSSTTTTTTNQAISLSQTLQNFLKRLQYDTQQTQNQLSSQTAQLISQAENQTKQVIDQNTALAQAISQQLTTSLPLKSYPFNFPDNRTVQTVYDAAVYGKDLRFPMDTTDLSAQAITFSTSTIRGTKESFTPSGTNAVTYSKMLHTIDPFISNTDSGLILHAGNNTAFNQNFIVEADMTGVIYQIQLNCAFAMNVSAYSSGNFNLNSVTFTAQSFQQNNNPFQPPQQFTFAPNTAFSNLTATGTIIFVIRDTIDFSFRMKGTEPLTLNCTINTTTGTGTYQVGLCPIFCNIATAAVKPFYQSEFIAHLHVVPEHIEELEGLSECQFIGMEPIDH